LAIAGPIARIRLTVVCSIHVSGSKRTALDDLTWLRPFVAPRDALLGEAADINIKIAPPRAV
jgi:hypothetical protein